MDKWLDPRLRLLFLLSRLHYSIHNTEFCHSMVGILLVDLSAEGACRLGIHPLAKVA